MHAFRWSKTCIDVVQCIILKNTYMDHIRMSNNNAYDAKEADLYGDHILVSHICIDYQVKAD